MHLLQALRDVALRLDALLGAGAPYLMAAQEAPRDEPDWHLAFDFFPLRRGRTSTKIRASVETATGLYLNDVLPETAARRLAEIDLAPQAEIGPEHLFRVEAAQKRRKRGQHVKPLGDREVWLVVGAQELYGAAAIAEVAQHGREVARALDAAPELPVRVVETGVALSSESIRRLCLDANAADACVGLLRLDAHLLAGQVVDRRTVPAPQARCCTCTRSSTESCRGRRSTWHS